MDITNLSGNLRHVSGKGPCNTLRNQKRVPGVLYGKEHENMMVEFSEMELNDIIKGYGENALVNIDFEGKEIKAMIKEVQRDPIKRNLTHIDMKYIKDDERVHADIPIAIRGEEFIRSRGGIVQKQLGSIAVEARPDRLPKYIVADVSKMDIGDKLTIANMEFSSDIAVDADIDLTVISITAAKEIVDLPETDEQKTPDNTQQ